MLQNSQGIKHTIFKLFWYSLPLKRSKFVTVVSESTKKELLRFVSFPAENIHVIPVSISSQFIYSRKEFNTDKPVILEVGTTPNKNIERLIEAIKGISCRLNIIGILPVYLITKLKDCQIEYTNYYNLSEHDLLQQYRESDLLSFVSTYEGFGMPIIEANATGRAVITSNILSMPEVAGSAACLVDPYNIEEIRNGILKIINDSEYRDALIKNGLENCKRFDAQQIADSYAALYRQIAS